MSATTNNSNDVYGTFETKRLSVVPWASIMEDPISKTQLCQELEQVLSPEVTSFLPEHLHYTPGVTNVTEWAESFGGSKQEGIVPVISTLRHKNKDDVLTGLMMLRPTTDVSSGVVLHLGYIFGKDYWGQGLATELLRDGLVEHLRKTQFEGTIHAGVDPENPASARVLQKAQFTAIPNDNKGKDDGVDWFQQSFPG